MTIALSVLISYIAACPLMVLGFSPIARGAVRPYKHNTRLFSSTALPEGITKTVVKYGNGTPLGLGDVATVKYSCYVPSVDGLSVPFAKSNKQKVVVGDGLMIKGWELALQTMEVGEEATVRISDAAQFGYGSAGVPEFVPPNAEIEMDMKILDSEPGLDMTSLSTTDPLKPVRIHVAFLLGGVIQSGPSR